MKMEQKNDYVLNGIFPCPIYTAHNPLPLDSTEQTEIDSIAEEGMFANEFNNTSSDTYIFKTKLKKIKQFCEKHIEKYVELVIDPKQKLDFYITQSWLNITYPNECHHRHNHSNSIISGVFYISTVEHDKILFYQSLISNHPMQLEPTNYNLWNSASWHVDVTENQLILFPSWLEHGVQKNREQTGDRMSLAFNVFAKGIFGIEEQLNELYLNYHTIL